MSLRVWQERREDHGGEIARVGQSLALWCPSLALTFEVSALFSGFSWLCFAEFADDTHMHLHMHITKQWMLRP